MPLCGKCRCYRLLNMASSNEKLHFVRQLKLPEAYPAMVGDSEIGGSSSGVRDIAQPLASHRLEHHLVHRLFPI